MSDIYSYCSTYKTIISFFIIRQNPGSLITLLYFSNLIYCIGAIYIFLTGKKIANKQIPTIFLFIKSHIMVYNNTKKYFIIQNYFYYFQKTVLLLLTYLTLFNRRHIYSPLGHSSGGVSRGAGPFISRSTCAACSGGIRISH